jgi:hypothetical protein
MANTIDVEAKRNVNLAVDVDKHRRKLRKTVANGISVQFVGPVINTFEKYRYYLLQHSVPRELNEKFLYRPDYLSHEVYGTTTLWPLLLFINDVASIEEFDISPVLVPTYSSILQITRFNELNVAPIDLDLQAQEPSRSEKIVLYSNKIAPTLIDQTPTVTNVQPPEDPVFYIRRRVTLTEVNILNESIDLAVIPIIESVTVKIQGENFAPIYDTHYTIIERPDGQLRRLTWSDDNNVAGSGLVDVLQVGSILELQYVQDENA